MNNDVLIEVSDVSKKFSKNLKRSLLYGISDVFSGILGKESPNELRKDEFWAVRGISFEVRRGECLGLIGHNGAGKSTLLKMLNGLIAPDTGMIKMRGKIGALIELGAGFNPVLTGRENIYNNGAILGMSKSEIDSKFDDIVRFCELNEFMDMPVQNYSSGMKVRLGFAVAAQMEPDILIIDEVLAVGDLGFVLKCFGTIDRILPRTAVIFVSHSMPQVSRMCTSIILMEKGKIAYAGNDIAKGIELYYSGFRSVGNKAVYQVGNEAELIELGFSVGKSVKAEQDGIFRIDRLEDLSIMLCVKIADTHTNPFVTYTFFDKEQRPVAMCHDETGLTDDFVYQQEEGFKYYRVRTILPRVNFSKGLYSVTVSVSGGFRRNPLLRVQHADQFIVNSEYDVWQPIEFESRWKTFDHETRND